MANIFIHITIIFTILISGCASKLPPPTSTLEVGSNKSVTPDTLFQSASIGKSLTGTATMHFVEAGYLVLDENVNDKLVSWKVPENEYTKQEKVTLRRLLSHSAGMTAQGFRSYAEGERIPTTGKWHNLAAFGAGGGLWTTPTDLARFGIEISKAYKGKSNKIISQQSAEMMLTPQTGTGKFGTSCLDIEAFLLLCQKKNRE